MAVDAADARVVGVAEIREPRRALAQRELERGHREQLRADAEDLQQVARRGVDRDDAVAETVGEERRFGLLAVADRGVMARRSSDGPQGVVQRRGPRRADRARSPATLTAMRQFTRSDNEIGRPCARLQPCRRVCVSVINFLCFRRRMG